MRKVKMLLVISLIVSTSSLWLDEVALALAFRGSSLVSGKTHNHVIRISPRPPGWPQMWFAKDVIKTLNENGLIVEKTRKEKSIELSSLPAKTHEAIKFSVSLKTKTLKACVLEFDNKKDFDKVLNHYLALNNNGELYTWSLIKDNILLVIDGSMPDQEMRKYEAILAEIK